MSGAAARLPLYLNRNLRSRSNAGRNLRPEKSERAQMFMENTIRRCTRIGSAVLVGMVIGYGQLALAGWTGQMNGTGYGKASVNVTSSTAKSNTVGTANMQSPSAAMTNTATYFAGGPLPSGASTATVARIKGSAGYVWKANTTATNGDKTDNSEIESRVNIVPADCALLTMDSSSILSS